MDRIRLYQQIECLEKKVANLEALLEGYASIEEKFILEVIDQFGDLLDISASDVVLRLGDNAIEKEDVIQEMLLYMLKYCLKEVCRRSFFGHAWLPYIKRTLRNCMVNLKQAVSKRITSFKSGDARQEDSNVWTYCNIEENLIIDELIEEITVKMSERDKLIFKTILDPPEDLIAMARQYCEHKKKFKITFKMIADYLHITYHEVHGSYTRIKNITRKVCSET